MSCTKQKYTKHKAKSIRETVCGQRMRIYHCKECNAWHSTTIGNRMGKPKEASRFKE